MIKHVYLFRLKAGVDKHQVAEKLMSLKENVPSIYEMEVGFDFKHADNSYDLIESITFLTHEDFRTFGADAYHETVRQYMAGVQSDGVKIDYEIG